MRGWLKARRAAEYAGVSERTFRSWFQKGLRSVFVGGTRLIKVEWVDSFLEKFEDDAGNRVDRIVEDVMEGLK